MKLPADDEEYEDDQAQFQLEQDAPEDNENRNGLEQSYRNQPATSNYQMPDDEYDEHQELDQQEEVSAEQPNQQAVEEVTQPTEQLYERRQSESKPASVHQSVRQENHSTRSVQNEQRSQVTNQIQKEARMEPQLSILNYRVLSCSSQDANHLVSELAAPKRDPAQVRGWLSQRFCVYPQDIVLQFPQPVKISKIQFLIHECFIPQQIHLSSFMPGNSIEEVGLSGALNSNNSQHLFVPLGHFQLDDNTGSNYQSRELKTVYLDLITQYFKVSFTKNYDNRLNKFNQVGVIKMQFTGTFLGEYEISTFFAGQRQQFTDPPMHQQYDHKMPAQPRLNPRNLKLQSVPESELDQSIVQKLQILQEKKDEAVRNEDYDLAIQLKEVCDNLKVMGNDLMHLESRKIQAIDGEDFEAAKILKNEIQRLKKHIDQIDPHRPLKPYQNQSQRNLHNSSSNNQANTITNTMDLSLNQREITQQNQDYLDQTRQEEFEDDGMAELQFTKQQQQPVIDDYGDEDQDQLEQSFRETASLRHSPTSNKFKNYDDQAVPALALKQPIDFKNITDEDGGGIGGSAKPDQNESVEYKDIPATMKTFADGLLPYYGELCCAKLFHRRWQFREEGVAQFIQEMPAVFQKGSQDNLTAVNSAILGALVEILKDKVQQIITKSFEAVEQYIRQLKLHSQLTVKADQAQFEKMLTYILDRLTDSRLLAKTTKLYLGFYEVQQIDQTYLTSYLFKQHSFINKQNLTQTNHQTLRLRVVQELITQPGRTIEQLPNDLIFPAIRACINASAADQRKVAQTLTVTIYQKLGWKKVEFLVQTGFGQKVLLALKPEMPEVVAYIKKE